MRAGVGREIANSFSVVSAEKTAVPEIKFAGIGRAEDVRAFRSPWARSAFATKFQSLA